MKWCSLRFDEETAVAMPGYRTEKNEKERVICSAHFNAKRNPQKGSHLVLTGKTKTFAPPPGHPLG